MTDDPRTVADDLVAGRYRPGAVLGRGGMADVLRATDQVLGREVALKLMRDASGSDSDRRRFEHEIRTLAGFSHPGLVTVLDGGTDAAGDRPFLVMELVDGPTLAEALRDGPLEPARAAEIGAQLADALAYVHGYGVVHRDLKPGNVLLRADGRVKLADFGIARLLGETLRHTRTGTTIGTAAYLAPEQVEGAEVTTAADVWSLGLLLLEALTGQQAYPGTPTESALARLSRAPDLPGDLPPGWRGPLARALDRDPARRPTAAELATALRAAGGAPTVPAQTRAEDAATATRLLPAAGTAYPGGAPSPAGDPAPTTGDPAPGGSPRHMGRGLPEPATHVSRTTRAGEWAREHPALVVAAALLLLILAVAAVAGGSAAGGGEPVDEVPADVPPALEPPLRDLHDAVRDGAP